LFIETLDNKNIISTQREFVKRLKQRAGKTKPARATPPEAPPAAKYPYPFGLPEPKLHSKNIFQHMLYQKQEEKLEKEEGNNNVGGIGKSKSKNVLRSNSIELNIQGICPTVKK
jgi:hypothetical protein